MNLLAHIMTCSPPAMNLHVHHTNMQNINQKSTLLFMLSLDAT